MKAQPSKTNSIGTGMHTEKHYPGYQVENTKKRSRNKCIYYEKQTKDCTRFRVGCVGPSNPLCKHYCEKSISCNASTSASTNKEKITIDTEIYDKQLGGGIVYEVRKGVYKVRFQKNNAIRMYFKSEIEPLFKQARNTRK